MAKCLSTIISPYLSVKTSKSNISNSSPILNRFWSLFVSTLLISYLDNFRQFLLTQLFSFSRSHSGLTISSVPFIRVQKFNISSPTRSLLSALLTLIIVHSISIFRYTFPLSTAMEFVHLSQFSRTSTTSHHTPNSLFPTSSINTSLPSSVGLKVHVWTLHVIFFTCGRLGEFHVQKNVKKLLVLRSRVALGEFLLVKKYLYPSPVNYEYYYKEKR